MTRTRQQGFSIVTAIFLLVVLGALGAMMVTTFATQQQGNALDAMGSRAYQAARSGVEWAAYQVQQTAPGSVWAGCATVPQPVFGSGSLSGALSPFVVNVSCSAASAVEGVTIVTVYSVVSTASAGGTPGSPDFVERALQVTLAR